MTQLWNIWTIFFSATLSLKRSLVYSCLVPLIPTIGQIAKNLQRALRRHHSECRIRLRRLRQHTIQ
ncbi:hypothetical protein TELCIR_23134 [Teladorsagia circumcincta]|uniref:Uncharacterized protein n=1 Tax=Teladorsagia circumcincta TaxID=45464 RepID=A0A2G9TBY0_TELCI|nr:hypothetical protein TELCIR_23134 [Teladorsagia circumcincta]